MTTQTIEQLFVFKKKVIQKKLSFPSRAITWIEHDIKRSHAYFTKDELTSYIESHYSVAYEILEEKSYKGEIFNLDGFKNKEKIILYNGKEYFLSEICFDADRGCNLFEVIVAEEVLEAQNESEINAIVDEILETYKKELEENKRYQENLARTKNQGDSSLIGLIKNKLIPKKRLF